MSLFDTENQRKIEDENIQKTIYTQLAQQGKFKGLYVTEANLCWKYAKTITKTK